MTSEKVCVSHLDCGRYCRVNFCEVKGVKQHMVALEVKEDRSGSATSKVRGGTHYVIKPEISNLARGGSGPKKILMQLVLNHAGDP
ncbi:hypothetical protein GQ600_19458 [Phytophthora cactorum]|nr:hypothetical protein GQ600_19458 [Phytophthora cactorum]